MEFEQYEYVYETEYYYENGYNHSNYTDFLNETFYMAVIGPRLSGGIEEFRHAYGEIHGYLSVIICLFGIAANIVNIIVLSRKHMTSPTNWILMALGIADMISLFTYFMFILYAKFYPHDRFGYVHNDSRGWIDYAIFWPHIAFTFEIYGMWLTITLAIFQYLTVCHNGIGPRICTLRNAKIAILIVGGVAFLMCLPEYLLYESKSAPGNMTGWILFDSYVIVNSPGLKSFYLVFYGIVVKLLACFMLIALSGLLIRAIYQLGQRRASFGVERRNSKERKNSGTRKVSRRTTVMLVAVVMVFVSAELPCGLFAFIGGCNKQFFTRVFLPLAEFFTLLTLINKAIKFILYCSMSEQFRRTFVELICIGRPKLLRLRLKSTESTSSSSSRNNILPGEETPMVET